MRQRAVLGGAGALVVFVLAGVVGGVLGFLIARGSVDPWFLPEYHPALAPLPSLIAAASIAGGVLAGWFVASLALSWAPGQIRCPRCGTADRRGASVCGACQLPFG